MIALDRLRGLIVSVQANANSPLARPDIIAALAECAQAGGAVAVRIEGTSNVRATKAALSVPVIGLIKRAYDAFEPYITPTLREVEELLAAGADVIALDATSRPRPAGATLEHLADGIRRAGAVAMGDCATEADGVAACALGIPIVATTLRGYTKETQGTTLPALGLVRKFCELGAFVICEGGIHTSASAQAALDAGADAIVVGTAITDVTWVTARFAAVLRKHTRTDASAVK
jgi:N-acylglucosamine-6-phosphate 2-epimerase